MNETSHACVSEVATMDDVYNSLTSDTCCEKRGHGSKSSIINGEMDGLGMDTSPCSTPYSTPPLSPQSSFSSFASCFSSFDSGEEIELRDAGQSHPGILFTDELMEKGIGDLVQMDEGRLSHASVVDDGATFPITAGQNILSGHLQLEIDQDATKKSSDDSIILWDTNVSSDPHRDILSDNQFTEIQRVVSVEDSDLEQSHMIDVEEVTSLPMPGGEFIPLNEHVMDQLDNTKENAIVYNNILNTEPDMKPGADFDGGSDNLCPLPSFDTDPLIWLPPEPANKEDDIDDAANHDDDSDNSDTRWARSSFDISFDEERSKGSRKDQLQKAMSEVMNGEFKILVSRFLAAEGFSLSDGRTNNCWLDIVASLSWDAALLVRPDAKGNEMDPGLYVKVKCIASGSRQQSEVIKGLVFKKSAAHKQMRTNIKHPKLLVLQGAIGHSSTGLSSMDLMKQENEQLEKTLNDVIRKYHPDVILVEKGVSRNLNEYFQKQGVTVVSDMNIRRLERIARCTGSPIISLQDVFKETNLIKQCESLRFEKLVDEHNLTEDDGRRSAKTFLFLEGLPEPLGCTILLKGSTRGNLKKIKSLLHFTVFAAYHLILETSFFADQRLFITENNATEKANSLETGPQLFVPCRASSQSKLWSDNSENRGTMKHDLNIPTSDEQYNLEDIATTKKHDSKIVTSRDPQGRLNDRKAESTSCGGFDGSTSASSKKLITQKKEAFGGNGEETFEDVMCTENRTDLNSQVILVSMSSQHIRSQAVCEQSHLSRITYYGYCDTTLGRYLQDILLNERHNCLSCLEPPEAHMYSYTHHDGTLTVLVKSLPLEATLPGEGQRRIWMWTRCLRCNGKPTQRVVISSSARNLSFGKFLELSFSTHSAAKKLSTCGHLLHRDCLRFFGLGSRVAMFRYSSIAIYSAFEPPLTWEFHNPNKKEWLDVEVKNVLLKWKLLFSEIEDILQGLKSRYSSQDIGGKSNISAYGGLILEVSGMLAQEKNELEVSLKAFDHIAKPEACAHEILQLNWLYQQLLLGLYIWDVRLRHLLQYSKVSAASSENLIHETILENKLRNPKNITVHGDTQYCSDDVDNSCGGMILEKGQLTDKSVIEEHELYRLSLSSGEEIGENGSRQGVSSVPIDNHICLEKSIFLPVKNDEHPEPVIGNEIYPVDIPKKCLPPLQNLLYFMRDDTKKWVWNKFSHMEMGYKKEIQGGSLDKFHLINKYSPYSSSLAQFKCQMDSMHFIARPCGTILSITEEEISSIIAYALAISEHQGIYSETSFARDELVARRNVDKVARSNLFRDASMPSSILSPSGSSEQDHNLSINASSLSLDKTTSGFYDSFLSALKDLHPEIGLNSEKLALKSKYTVVSIYAKQFYNFRKICCPSELAYILSISRCKIWNAQGGKSKAFFAKSMDDRFIIKQIKKTEFDSFLKFGLEYFKHFGVSNASSNPTCLAKILGIYQVKELRNGKETRTNFMVMENLLFGHDILRRYDLKGALFSRYVPNSKNPESVLLDQNFIEDMRTMPIYIEGKNKNLMERAIWNDTSFLCGMNVMDYSLFLGVDKQKKELVFGIIDYLRQYTWDKQLESWVKTSLVVPKNLSPTVISPKEYKIRFRAFMSQYFLSVPDA